MMLDDSTNTQTMSIMSPLEQQASNLMIVKFAGYIDFINIIKIVSGYSICSILTSPGSFLLISLLKETENRPTVLSTTVPHICHL